MVNTVQTKKSVRFIESKNTIENAVSSIFYDRTPILSTKYKLSFLFNDTYSIQINNICCELNMYKKFEMEVHPESKNNTKLYTMY
jgi:hypothetical protein